FWILMRIDLFERRQHALDRIAIAFGGAARKWLIGIIKPDVTQRNSARGIRHIEYNSQRDLDLLVVAHGISEKPSASRSMPAVSGHTGRTQFSPHFLSKYSNASVPSASVKVPRPNEAFAMTVRGLIMIFRSVPHAPGNSSVNHTHGAFSMRVELSLADAEDRSWLPMTGAINRLVRIATPQRALRTVSS
ncbi:MAG: hypothetical protein WA268_04950, partial [Xanthobacteraceae bacterium]